MYECFHIILFNFNLTILISNNIVYFYVFGGNEIDSDFIAQTALEPTVILLPQAPSPPVPSTWIRITDKSHHTRSSLTGF